ncbi:acetyl/propionyl/methylcrotonyl-CoA carboxylase subunit alpha [Comamonas composti]|uniref:acetyl/propionyl/methylcrotonyl-CoA carboxylase subunit alpha n=1 Tax=Comamonas composti TaxID=408558 RepID=UPI0004039E4A|nr:biotin carboxylase N-terminal domain-containing protein [Comamonas composti]
MKKILIANRGEIARRIARTARRMGIATVAVYSDADARSLHVGEADEAVALGGLSSADSYLRMDKLIAAARATGAEAIHPGYGFLSEDARFARLVEQEGLIWIGPPSEAIEALGSKSAAKALAQKQGVPCLPGYAGTDQRDERFEQAAAEIGFPVMVKAVAGGGGRGMRLVQAKEQLKSALASARSEAVAGFGNADLLMERAVQHPRHVEVQVFADRHGRCIHLGERDCSVQRRHQKIIEESPSPAVNAELRERMGACAVALARAAGYVGAGTVEFLLEGQDFYLMEMNTRLQVEHPVTEALTGLDLVEWQIRVARGEALPLAQQEVSFSGHAIELRICAEDESYVPHTGRVLHLQAPRALEFERGALRWDHALAPQTEVSPHYDAMLGKLIIHAPTRAEAIERALAALGQLCVLGLPTNRGFLMQCLDHALFREGRALISFLAEHGDVLRERLVAREKAAFERHGLAAAYGQGLQDTPLACIWEKPLRLRWRGETRDWAVTAQGGTRLRVRQGEQDQTLELHGRAPQMQLVADGLRQGLSLVHVPGRGPNAWHMQADGVDWWLEDASLSRAKSQSAAEAAQVLRAPFNGKLVQVAAQAGQTLSPSETALVIESMKLEHSLCVSAPSVVQEVLVAPGQQVTPGQVLLRLQPVQAEAPALA